MNTIPFHKLSLPFENLSLLLMVMNLHLQCCSEVTNKAAISASDTALDSGVKTWPSAVMHEAEQDYVVLSPTGKFAAQPHALQFVCADGLSEAGLNTWQKHHDYS